MGHGGKFLAVVSLVIQAIIFILVTVGTPLDAYHSKHKVGRYCYSMWGIKRCGNHKVNPDGLPNKGFPCKKTMNTMNAAAAFAIVSIFFTLLTTVLCGLVVCDRMSSLVPAILSGVCIATMVVAWACQAGALHQHCDGADSLGTSMKYVASFGLFITAWCLQVIHCVLMILI